MTTPGYSDQQDQISAMSCAASASRPARMTMPSSIASATWLPAVEEQTRVDGPPNRSRVGDERPTDGQQRAGGTVVRQAQPAIDLVTEGEVNRGQRCAEADGAAGEQ